jgi:hypothetical protein
MAWLPAWTEAELDGSQLGRLMGMYPGMNGMKCDCSAI